MPLVTDRQKCAHLLRRFGLGASEAELDFYAKNGLSSAIDLLLNYETVDEAFTVPLEVFKNAKQNRVPMPGLVTWWTLRLLMTRRPLQEKMTLFWHNHFATSASKVTAPLVMHQQNEILRRNATGNFRKLLSEVSKDPAMVQWLDCQQNVKGHANENFAREVMELFTLGIGHYTEKDIQEGAKAFTGWALRRTTDPVTKTVTAEFIDRPLRHDSGQKSFLGNRGNFNGDDILNILCDQPRTAEYLVWKMWSWFCYPNPEPALVSRLAAQFRQSGLDIKALLKAIMTSPEFYSPKAERAIVKSPVDVCITTLRQLGVGESVGEAVRGTPVEAFPRARVAPAAGAMTAMKAMGMWLFYPPDVSGWKFGQAWISSATMVERMGWAEHLFGQAKSARFRLQVPTYAILSGDPTPEGAVKTLISAFDVQLKPEKVKFLVQAAQKTSGGHIDAQNAAETASAISRLMFASPEFQLC